jgi:hypothetical protein
MFALALRSGRVAALPGLIALRWSSSKPDYYRLLGIPTSASSEQIKTAYYEQSKLHHPDRNPGTSASSATFALISEAYSVLGQVDSRRAYDEGESGRAMCLSVFLTSLQAAGGDLPRRSLCSVRL